MSIQLSNQCSQSETNAELSANLLSMKKFVFINILILSVCAGAMAQAGGTAANYTRPDADKRFKRFVNDTVGPILWVGVGAGAAFSTAADTPKEWGRSTEGFGRRFASNFGKTVIRNTVIYGINRRLSSIATITVAPNAMPGPGSRMPSFLRLPANGEGQTHDRSAADRRNIFG